MTAHNQDIHSKDATLKLKLHADSGYTCETEYRISAAQWGRILEIAESPEAPASTKTVDLHLSRHSRAMLLNVLWHHQGGSSPVGQPIRAMLGIGQHEHLAGEALSEAKWIDALLAKAEAPASEAKDAAQWQPIETAPNDGTVVIVGRDMGSFGFVRGYGYFEGKPGSFVSGWVSNGFNEFQGNLGLAHPTHWMPLPPPPAIDTAMAQQKGGA